MRLGLILSLFAACLALTGCNTTASSETLLYEPPAGPALALIKGSQLQDPGLFGARHVAYVMMVNGQFVREAEENWAQALPLRPGAMDIAVEYRSSVFRSRAVFSFEAKPGARYLLRLTPGITDDDRHTCDFVIVDEATGTPVAPAKKTYATNSSSTSKSNFRPLD